MLLTTSTIQRAESEVKEIITKNIKKAVKVAKVIGEIAILFVYVDTNKYQDLVQNK